MYNATKSYPYVHTNKISLFLLISCVFQIVKQTVETPMYCMKILVFPYSQNLKICNKSLDYNSTSTHCDWIQWIASLATCSSSKSQTLIPIQACHLSGITMTYNKFRLPHLSNFFLLKNINYQFLLMRKFQRIIYLFLPPK